MNITRYRALGIAQTLVEANLRAISVDYTKLMPLEDCEGQWDLLWLVDHHLRELMIENRPEETANTDYARKKGDAVHDEEPGASNADVRQAATANEPGSDHGQAGTEGSHVNGGQSPAGPVEGKQGAVGVDSRPIHENGVPEGVQVATVGGKQMEARPLLERLAVVMGGGMTPIQTPQAEVGKVAPLSSRALYEAQGLPVKEVPNRSTGLRVDRDGQVRF